MEVEGVRFSSERLRGLTGWKPEYDFEAGLRRVKSILEGTGRTENR
jgi:hypothetical protein